METMVFTSEKVTKNERSKIVITADINGIHIVSVEERYDENGNLRYSNLEERVYKGGNGKVTIKFSDEKDAENIEPACADILTILGLL